MYLILRGRPKCVLHSSRTGNMCLTLRCTVVSSGTDFFCGVLVSVEKVDDDSKKKWGRTVKSNSIKQTETHGGNRNAYIKMS